MDDKTKVGEKMGESMTIGVYRRPRLPGDHLKKPAFLLHFYFVPDENKSIWPKMSKGGRRMSMFRIIGLLVLLSGMAQAVTRAELEAEIETLTTSLSSTTAQVSALSASQADLISTARSANIGRAGILVAGVSTGNPGADVVVPVSFVKGPSGVAAIQFEVIVPSSFTLTSVVAGPAATAAGKSVQYTLTNGVARIIIFGLNQTTIGTGVVANMTMRPSAATPRGNHSIPVCDPVASDAIGTSVLILEAFGKVIL